MSQQGSTAHALKLAGASSAIVAAPTGTVLRFAAGKLARKLRLAIETEVITPAFQPLFDLRNRGVSGFEILARWTDEEHGDISPIDFIPLAEAEGLLDQLTESLLRRACLAAITWPDHLTLAVNISPLQLQDPGVAAMIQRAVAPSGFPLTRLEVELTEQALIMGPDLARVAVNELKALGIRVVLDDFGTGHAGLSRLLDLPFDKLKIDGSFIRALDQGSESRKIVASMISLGLSLGIATVAEGVEQQSQADTLLRLGCSISQGWLHGRPIAAKHVPAMLMASQSLESSPSAAILFPAYLPAEQRMATLESLFHTAPVGLCYLDLGFRYVTVNERFAEMYRLPAASLIGRTVQEALPGPAAQIVAHLERALATETAIECEITVDDVCESTSAEPRESRIYQRAAQPVRDSSGTIVGLSVALVDITERKRTEVALRESEANYRHTVELNPHIPWTTDGSGEITSMSPRWYAFTGVPSQTILLTDWIVVLHPEDGPKTMNSWMHSVRTGDPYDATYRLRSASGTWRWVRARAFPRRDAQGKIVRWYGTLEDIHERWLLEAALQKKTVRLEEATAELARLARVDHLTGLANRRSFDATLDSEIKRAQRTQLPLTLIVIDVDHFKRYNDTFGHVAGDGCLREIARVVAAVFGRPGDLTARYGGEEFAVILPQTAEADAIRLAEQVVAAIRKMPPSQGDAREQHAVTISAGVAMLAICSDATDTLLARELIKAADLALYQAKADGRDRVACAMAATPA